MEVICINTEAFYKLINTVIERVADERKEKHRWINDEETMIILNIKSKSTLQKLRDEGAIRFSQPMKKVILYDRESLEQYIEQHAKDTF